ncbi:hypothetical protein [Candidatus Methylobacter favarea]|uniref:hypothetical protein n=1 Tax=Candidatus Methylobacter favarea TaxID=2707345 RepID=UPI00157D5932|nr:hypothetical protein [Candidatus Methylobacter favarea]
MITYKKDNQELNSSNILTCCCSQQKTKPESDVTNHKGNLALQALKPKPTKEPVDIEELFQKRLQRQLK